MAVEIKMPQLSDTMDSGKILSWSKKEGDQIERGDILAEVETDKANLEIEAFYKGTLLKIVVPAETAADVGAVIAYIGEPGEEVPSINGSDSESALQEPVPPPPEEPQAAPLQSTPATPEPSPAPAASTGGRVKISPLAKKMASQHNVDLGTLRGSGPDGRIVRKDIEAAIGTSPTPSQTTPEAEIQGPPPPPSADSLTPFSKMRATIAKRMQQSVVESPHFYTTISINMTEAKKLRGVLKTKPEYTGLSINHFIMKAAAYGLRHEPRVNRAVRDGQLFTPAQINIGMFPPSGRR